MDIKQCDAEVLAIAAAHDAALPTIYVWADGTWCEEDELEQMTHMSDDYATVTVHDEETSEQAADRYSRLIGAYK